MAWAFEYYFGLEGWEFEQTDLQSSNVQGVLGRMLKLQIGRHISMHTLEIVNCFLFYVFMIHIYICASRYYNIFICLSKLIAVVCDIYRL